MCPSGARSRSVAQRLSSAWRMASGGMLAVVQCERRERAQMKPREELPDLDELADRVAARLLGCMEVEPEDAKAMLESLTRTDADDASTPRRRGRPSSDGRALRRLSRRLHRELASSRRWRLHGLRTPTSDVSDLHVPQRSQALARLREGRTRGVGHQAPARACV